MSNQNNPVVVWSLVPPSSWDSCPGENVSLQPLLLQPAFGWSRGFPCASAWGESSAQAFKDADLSVPEKARFEPKGMKMLPLTPVCVPNIYKRVDLRCAHRFWEVLELLTRIKTTSYGTCCAVSPTSHAQWVFLARSSTSLTLSRWFFILLRVTETFPQDAFFSLLRISMYSYVKYSSNRQQLCKLVHSHRVVFNATERNGLIFTQPWVAQCPRILREVKLAWQGWGAAEQASFPLGTQKKEPHPNGETCAWAETHSPPPHIYPRLPSSGPLKCPKSPSQKEAGPSPPP